MTKYVPVAEQSEEDLKWMREALAMAQEAFSAAEVPVGCVFVRNGKLIAKARNRTNELMNATRHAELEAIDYILSIFPPKNENFSLSPHSGPPGDNPFAETTLYVTIEPCIMCASALRQVGIKRVCFGAGNERFGGNGSVVPVHSDPMLKNAPPYEAVGGFYREDAIMLLRRFYLTENVYAPNPRSKAKRVLKTVFQPPGVSMHGPNGQNLKKTSSRRRNRSGNGTRSSTPGGTSDASGSGAEAMSSSTSALPSKHPVEIIKNSAD